MSHAKTLQLLEGQQTLQKGQQNISHKESNASDEKHFQEEISAAMFFRGKGMILKNLTAIKRKKIMT